MDYFASTMEIDSEIVKNMSANSWIVKLEMNECTYDATKMTVVLESFSRFLTKAARKLDGG